MKRIILMVLATIIASTLVMGGFASAGLKNDHITKAEREIIDKLFPDKKLTDEQEDRVIKMVSSEYRGEAIRTGNYGDFENRLYNKQWDESNSGTTNNSSNAINVDVNGDIEEYFTNHFVNELAVVFVEGFSNNYILKTGMKNPVLYYYYLEFNKYEKINKSLYIVDNNEVTVDSSVKGYIIISVEDLAKK